MLFYCLLSGALHGCVYGRGYPDLSVGSQVPAVLSGVPMIMTGTSVSTPVMAGLVMHLNAAIRDEPGLQHQKIGFMNPFLYWAARKYPTAFTDITIGSNFVYDSSGRRCPLGYETAPAGWDPVTGLGMPNIKVLQRAAVKWVKRQIKKSK
ncbi:hypothetical protein CEUSTIGMA_g8571.t1 [Chlamydomonas eustigma]|uniref:Peptidase S53 domain-containing protein n=1 Tax=Chlamydomonas eustigma TaxID=1157962 RepID=A0A250XDH2_9CHLO|nr:hypothetical protein CEUSTIGMA_g8571.t1 [Chlamydomonas eustigma]|eukprot:GAX81137.1 hypothetical protein CEUSTIGMA_g8571.t1 [Chlamydomonas eustigma]